MATGRLPDFDERIERTRLKIERGLDRHLPRDDEPPGTLHAAMRHAVLGGGKRFRGILCVETHRLLARGEAGASIDAACALEALHAYTLVHDDLPSLDDDAIRRGRPSCHAAFGEATAILAGDALQALAFGILARCGAAADRRIDAVGSLAEAAGSRLLVGGQQADLDGEETVPTPELVSFIHERKTAALISAAMEIGAIIAGSDRETIDVMAGIGRSIGLAFQIADDLLDVEGEEQVVGKGLRKDKARGKITWPAVHGVEASRERARTLVSAASDRVAEAGDDGLLRELFRRVVERRS
ncbi:MAG: polyprenyl synthetase family protein [Candidatus Krumholzibacteriota bacterium]|nr:polyprenyl synthetase family protein [Candidatus Krumholzibacteriota bacterium]